MTIWASKQPEALLRFWRPGWVTMVRELGRRGRGERESGAFLLADKNGDQRLVTRVVYLDDLDPNCLRGGIHLNGLAYSKLWDLTTQEHRRVVGDVHTHPASGVRQSPIDAANPMISSPGHVALILPDFATHRVRPRNVGVHLYDGNGWTTWCGTDAARRIRVSWFV